MSRKVGESRHGVRGIKRSKEGMWRRLGLSRKGMRGRCSGELRGEKGRNRKGLELKEVVNRA